MALVGNISGSSLQNSVVGVSGTLILANRPNALFPTFPGNDVSLFVSGNIGGQGGSDRSVSVFGGDLVVSGNTNLKGALTASGGIYATGDVLDVSGSFILTGSAFITGFVSASALTGSLTRLSDGTPYLLAGSNITLSTGSSGAVTIATTGLASVSAAYVTIGNDATLTNERALTAGTGLNLTDGGANSTVTLGIDDSVVATISGSTFTGAVKFNAGLSGSLTQLVDGTSYLIAGANVTITSASNGAVTIAATAPAQAPTYWFSDVAGVTYNTGSLVAMTHLSASNGAEITGSLFVTQNVVVTGSAIIAGDLTVNGTMTTINTTNLEVKDALIGLGFASGSVEEADGDRGLIGSLTGDNVAVFWDNSGSEFAVVRTDSTPSATSVNVTSYAKLHAGDISGSAGTFSGDLVVSGNVTLGDATSDTLTFNARAATDLLPSSDMAYNLGSTNLRWANVYTGDLHLRNDRGHYTIIEEEDYLSIKNHKTGKLYKFVLEEVSAPRSTRKSRKTK